MFKEVIESATLNPLFTPNNYWAELKHWPSSVLFTDWAWLDGLPQVINIYLNSKSLQTDAT